MEFPELGKNCFKSDCHKLDFLPINCNACNQVFCSDHYQYDNHDCSNKHIKDFQVPICPLCLEPIPTPRDVSADVTVGEHIDRFCKSEKTKIYTNRCTFKNCRKKELVPFNCSICKMNFCLKHRHTSDHSCQGPVSQRSMAAQAALRRQQHSSNTSSNTQSRSSDTNNLLQKVQGTMSEDEALARALQLSMEEEEANRNRNPQNTVPRVTVGNAANSNKDKCALS